ncbi:MAG: uroporphyrinogen decarboxylase [Simkania sp.]|nr:uroporphyrinogen decarboxylase [Simkania sp.]MCB1074735.1 uroporphyrinogen decarboxylase [Simkania sp.]MCB1083215.1 uroporphyrinogen decarboxylase [Simkania sp.]MCP5490026.1 uroporphyrinogen decarboxylase [Chlamydiales bacterium]
MNLDSQSMPSSTVSSLENSRFLNALKCRNHEGRPPIWIMRQAGRYLPEYQKLRQTHTLEQLFRRPEKIAEVTLQPLKRFPLDAAILFADILHILLPLGCDVTFPQTGGPQVSAPERLQEKDVANTLDFVKSGIQLLKEELSVPLIGFCGGPFTVAHYLLEKKPEKMLHQDPKGFRQILEMITDASLAYLKMQIDAGVHAIQIFDSWAGTLPRAELEEFVLPTLKKLTGALNVPTLIFSRGSAFYVQEFLSVGADGISFDAGRPLAEIRKEVPKQIAVQGNLPPEFLYSPPDVIRKKTREHLASMQGDPGFIMNLGHGMLPDIPVENVQTFIETVTSSPSVA